MPGGKVEPGEPFREGAARELLEETGLQVLPARLTPASLSGGTAATGRCVIRFSYSVVLSPRLPLTPEPGKEARWWPLEESWESSYPGDRAQIVRHRDLLRTVRAFSTPTRGSHSPR